MLLSLAVFMLPLGGLLAAGMDAAEKGSILLADLHGAKKLGCADCHGSGKKIVVDDSETKVNKNCINCHGTLEALAAKAKGHINPHGSHLGQINCTVCHHGHEQSKAYCNGCHSFDLPMAGGSAVSKAKPARKPGTKRVDTTDVVVVGAGAAGMTAAITAHDAGAKVIVLEKQPITGGNSMLAAGGMNAAETRFQKEKGIKDSVDLMYDDTMKGGKNLNDPELVKILARNSASSIDWLTSIGADVSDVGRMAGASANRTHRCARTPLTGRWMCGSTARW
jgi:fumarate reductase flavoprotein subunit